ncbi:MAG: maleylpyruvate isomerase family mycothiol-dependent enzyme [Chloroflexota bacterium]
MQAIPTETRYVRSETLPGPVRDAVRIRPVTRREAYELVRAEYQRMVGLILSLQPDDWQRPTACALWDVKSMVAHIAGALAGYASWTQFKRQYSPLSYKPYKGKYTEQVDMINAVQVDDRRDRSPEELIAELRTVGLKALATRSRIPAPIRAIRIPVGRFGFISLGYLLDTIYSRDMWMHRVDLCNATGREMRLSPEHDGRIVALVVRDLVRSLAPKLEGASVLYDLRGQAGGIYRVGEKAVPTATIRMDALAFNLLASGRTSLAQARALNLVEIEGDTRLADLALKNTAVLY